MPGWITQSLKDVKERTEEDGVREEERMQGGVVAGGGIEEIFFLICNLQDGDGQGTMSDGG